MRRTISNLSRELMVSRPLIYRALKRFGIKKESRDEFSIDVWNFLVSELSSASGKNKQKKIDIGHIEGAGAESTKKTVTETDKNQSKKISGIDEATLIQRLECAKQEFDYNKILISRFQDEADKYFKETGKTTMISNNGTLTAIPSIVNLDKYVKLNISLSKLITEIEDDLDLEVGGGDDPFG